MSWRDIVIASSAKLDYQLGFMVVRGTGVTKVHLGEIRSLLIENTSVSITTALLSELIKKKVKVVFCDEKRNPMSELVSYYGSHDTSMKIRTQISWQEDVKKLVWTEIVTEKIRKQAELLSEGKKSEAAMLASYINEIEFDDATNREGHAAKVYFNALFGMDFSRSTENNINAALNYGYSVILSAVNRAISINGYITQLGIHHDNMFNQFNLGSDLMEPFRPIVDRMVLNMKLDRFEHNEKIEILNLMHHEVRIAERMEYLCNAIDIYVRSVFDALNENDVSLIKFYQNE